MMDLRQRQRVIFLVTNGVSVTTAAKLVGVTKSAVDGLLRRQKIQKVKPALSMKGKA